MALSVIGLLAGLVILYFGAEFLVAGASKIALSFGISPLIVGLTVVAFATSAPEFVVSLLAALKGTPNIAVGNVVGSNIANIALIVGVSSVILPMSVERSVFSRDYPLMILVTVVTLATAYFGANINRFEGVLLLLCLTVFLGLCVRVGVQQNREFRETGQYQAQAHEDKKLGLQVAKCVVGLAGLVVGAQLMVSNAVTIATSFGVSELVIGVTIVALGTSLPELATSVVAALRKEQDISMGNIIGSNIYNMGFILGGVSLIKPIENIEPQALTFDLPYMAAVGVLLFPLMRIDNTVRRGDGVILLIVYVSYLVLTYMISTGAIAF